MKTFASALSWSGKGGGASPSNVCAWGGPTLSTITAGWLKAALKWIEFKGNLKGVAQRGKTLLGRRD